MDKKFVHVHTTKQPDITHEHFELSTGCGRPR